MPATTRASWAVKVPEITAIFWAIKILTTAMGESLSDFLVAHNEVIAVAIGLFGFLFAMWLQFRADRYVPWIYWFAVAMVAVFGTMAADGAHVVVGLPYPVTTTLYALALVVIFVLWYRSEGTLSIHSINTRRREVYYWLTVLATFALGTATGDLCAATLHLGYFGSGVLFTVVILIPAIGRWRLGFNSVFAFWFAYVITRPIGASFADWFGKPHHHGAVANGLGLGDGAVAGLLIVAIVALVGYLSVQRSSAGRHDASLSALQPEVETG